MQRLHKSRNKATQHICECFDHELLERWGVHCFVLEYIGGGSLEDLRRSAPHGKLSERVVCAMAEHLLMALTLTHAQKTWRRDIKPDNIMISEGQPPLYKLVDFGIASSRVDSGRIPAKRCRPRPLRCRPSWGRRRS